MQSSSLTRKSIKIGIWCIGLILLYTLNLSANTASEFPIDEKALIKALLNSSSQINILKSQAVQAKFEETNLSRQYSWNWVSQAEYTDSEEKALASISPTFGPTYTYTTGLQKNFTSGLTLDTNVFTTQQSTTNSTITDANRTGVAIELSVDLWKNLFGQVDRSALKDMNLQKEKILLQTEVEQKITILQMRKLYWSLVANEMQTEVTKGLLATARQQLKDAQQRGKQYIADKGEIASYRAQVSNREAVIKNLNYQRDLLLQNIKMQIPELANKNIVINPKDFPTVYASVFQCVEKIDSYKGVPWQYTKMDELLKIEDKSIAEKRKQASQYSNLDLQLNSKIQISGVDQGFQDAYKDLSENGETGYSVGLRVNIALGSTTDKTQQSYRKMQELRYQAEKNRLNAQVYAKQTQISKMIQILKQAVESLKYNDQNLSISIASNQKKFKQARIPLASLINEQNQLLNTRLTAIDTKLQVLHTLFDYFQTFTDDPCSLNKIEVL